MQIIDITKEEMAHLLVAVRMLQRHVGLGIKERNHLKEIFWQLENVDVFSFERCNELYNKLYHKREEV